MKQTNEIKAMSRPANSRELSGGLSNFHHISIV